MAAAEAHGVEFDDGDGVLRLESIGQQPHLGATPALILSSGQAKIVTQLYAPREPGQGLLPDQSRPQAGLFPLRLYESGT